MKGRLILLLSPLLLGWLVRNPCYVGESGNVIFRKVSDVLQEREYRAIVKGIIFDRATQNPVVILLTEDESRFVPIWIGFAEAMSIDMVMKNIKPPRPMTHDLIKDFFDKFGAKPEKVSIVDIKENTYYAVIKVKTENKAFDIDSRPSDAIAIALRFGAPIYITQKILDVSIRVPDEEKAQRIWNVLGVSLQFITPELESFFGSKGLVISDVKKGSPAEGKLKRGDIITKINGKDTTDEKSISLIKEEVLTSSEVEMQIIRDGEKKKIKIHIPTK